MWILYYAQPQRFIRCPATKIYQVIITLKNIFFMALDWMFWLLLYSYMASCSLMYHHKCDLDEHSDLFFKMFPLSVFLWYDYLYSHGTNCPVTLVFRGVMAHIKGSPQSYALSVSVFLIHFSWILSCWSSWILPHRCCQMRLKWSGKAIVVLWLVSVQQSFGSAITFLFLPK